MYSEKYQASLEAVAQKRAANVAMEPQRMTAEQKETLLKTYHPDYREDQFSVLEIGPNKGDKVPHELCEMLQAHSRITADCVDLTAPDYDVDVLVIGAGGAGASAAIEAHEAGANVLIVTKLRMGDANTMMAEGGIQAADKPNDSPAIHFVDAFGGGHFAAKHDLLAKLVCDAPEAIQWLSGLGVEFDKEADGTMVTTHGGGTSRKRMHAAKDYSGAEIMRTLRDEVLNRQIPVVDFTSAIELILDENGNAAGAVLMNMETKELLVAKAKTVVIATGGAGRMHYQGFPTSNHYGATADVSFSAIVQAQSCSMQRPCSTTRQAQHIRSRSSARSLRKRFVPSVQSLSIRTAKSSCIRSRLATLPQLLSSVSAPTVKTASRQATAQRFGSIPR